ncbi:MAG: hypothetical protein ACREMJ_12560, partial [Gemmatimonadales bacterium]
EWAAAVELDVGLPREQWERFTDFGVTVFDSLGRQVAQHPLNYAFGRERIALSPERAGQQLLVELFPAYAWTDRTPPWAATVSVAFLLPEPRALAGTDVTVVAGGRVRVPLPDAPDLVVPAGFAPLLDVVLAGATRRIPLGPDW